MKGEEISLRINVIDPPTVVVFALQRGRSELHQATRSSGAPISFDFRARVVLAGSKGRPDVLGPFVQGRPESRYVYVNSGTYAGDSSSCWSRRAKVPLIGISRELIRELRQRSETLLECRIAGTGGDGGPACASVPLLGEGWAAHLPHRR